MPRGDKKAVKRGPPGKFGAPQQRQLTCFVVTGFGNKTDYATGRVLNLDKSFEQLVRPACDAVDVNCFRAIDANTTGSIDAVMYRWIYEADIVVADLSTLNANVFYELGVRHAQRPNTTIIIAESVLMQKIPFDLSSFVIHEYEHGGQEISESEQNRFVGHLSGVLDKVLATDTRRLQRARKTDGPSSARKREADSPVFKFLNGMTPPDYAADTYLEPPKYQSTEQRAKYQAAPGQSLASVVKAAELATTDKNFTAAIRLLEQAVRMQSEGKAGGKPDVYVAQQLALVTYKAGEKPDADGNVDKDVAIAALHSAQDVLARYCAPNISTDPETMALSGAINKRLFTLTDDIAYLAKAIGYYNRGFYVRQDYYSGINVAYLYTQRANLLDNKFDAIVSYGHANMIRQTVAEVCEGLIDDDAAFANRGDKVWVYMTLAEAYQGLGRTQDEERLARQIDGAATAFAKDTYLEQKARLKHAMDAFEHRVCPAELGAARSDEAGAQSVDPLGGQSAQPAQLMKTNQRFEPSASSFPNPITIDTDIVQGKPVKSIEVTCKIEYAQEPG